MALPPELREAFGAVSMPDYVNEDLSSYEVDYDGLAQAALEKKAAQSVSAENGAEPKDAAPVGAPQTPAVVDLTTGEAPEKSNALTWILGGAGVAVIAAAVIGWIWIRTRKRNESR